MANNRVQVKRTSTAGRTPNTTNSGNLQYIAAGEFGLNMADQILYTSNGTVLITVGANQVNQRITNSLTLDNDRNLYWKTVNTSAAVGMRQQTDDNFVFYSTNTTYGARPVFSIFANSDTSAFSLSTPVTFNANVTQLPANGTTGSAGQVLTASGTGGIYWAAAGAASVNVNAQYVWTNTQTFQANISFTGNNISLVTNTGSVLFNGSADANWRIGRNTGGTTKFFYTGNTIDIIAANTATEGIAFGFTGNAYLETGYAGTFTQNPIYVGNTTQNVFTTNTTIKIQANSTVNATATASLVQISNSTSTANLTAADLKIGATTIVNSTQVTATLLSGNLAGSYANITGQVNTATLYAATSANIASAVQANATGVYTTGTVNAASHTVGTAFTANSTVVNAVSYYSGTLLVANTTVINATHLGGVAAASYVQNTDSRTLSGNLNFTGVNTTISANLSVVNSTANIAFFHSNGHVLIGSSTPEPGVGGSAGGKLQVHGSGFDTFSVYAISDTLAPSLRQHRKRVTGGTVQAGDITGIQQFAGWSGTNYRLTGRLVSAIDSGTISDTSMPGYFSLETTPDASVTPLERMRITQSGNVGIGNTAPNARLQVTGTANVSGNVAIAGVTTLSTNVVLGTTTITANGGVGTAGQVLTSGATGNVYWTTPTTGTVTSVASGNGITGGTITTTGTLVAVAGVGTVVNTTGINVLANNGIVANSTGTFVNAQTPLVANATGLHIATSAGSGTYTSGISAITVDSVGRVTSVTGGAGYVTSSGVTSVATGNGITGGTITSTGTLVAVGGVGTVVNTGGLNVLVGNNQLIANATGVWVDQTKIDHNLLSNYVADQHVAHSTVSITAGNGLTGGGTIAASRTLDVGAGNGITVGADTVAVTEGVGLAVNTTGVHVKANTGIVANSTGTFVNAAYIATIASNSATYANASITNTFTVGTASYFVSNGNLGVGTSAPGYRLEVNGSFAATTKSFVIDHPTRPDMRLRYGSLEGPENGVYVRGRSNTSIIELPDYWIGLVDENSITVNLTPIGKKQVLYIKSISNNIVTVSGARSLNYFYTVYAERKDVEKLVVEF